MDCDSAIWLRLDELIDNKNCVLRVCSLVVLVLRIVAMTNLFPHVDY